MANFTTSLLAPKLILRSSKLEIYYPGQKNGDNRAHVAQARDLSSMHAPMIGLRACLNFFGQGNITVLQLSDMSPSRCHGHNQ